MEIVNTETAQSTRGSTEDRLKELETNFCILMNAVDDVERSTKVLSHNFAIFEEELRPKCNIWSKSALANHERKQHGNLKISVHIASNQEVVHDFDVIMYIFAIRKSSNGWLAS